jgi:hypothetical protein
MRIIPKLYHGVSLESNLLLKTLINFNKLFYLNILDIKKLIALLDNLICMDFINHEKIVQKVFLVIPILLKIGMIFCLQLKEKLNQLMV